MELKVIRKWKKDKYTIGDLYIDGVWFSNTLEDAVRDTKIYGKTAIPYGTYRITMDVVSPRFKDRSWAKPYGGKIPRLVDVPGFDGILIRPLTLYTDSLGSIGVGNNSIKGMFTSSSRVFMTLITKHLLPTKINGEHIYITID